MRRIRACNPEKTVRVPLNTVQRRSMPWKVKLPQTANLGRFRRDWKWTEGYEDVIILNMIWFVT